MENEKISIMSLDQLHNIIDLIKEFNLKSKEFLESLNEGTEELTDLMTFLFKNDIEDDDNEDNYPFLFKDFSKISNIRNTLFLKILQYQLILNQEMEEDNNLFADNIIIDTLNNYVNLEFCKQIYKAMNNEELSENIDVQNITFSYKLDNTGNIYLTIKENEYNKDEKIEEDINFNDKNNSEDKEFLRIDELNDIGKDNFLIYSTDPVEDEYFINFINETLKKNIIFALTYSKIDIKNTIKEVIENNEKEKHFVSLLFLSKDFSHCLIEEFNKRYNEKIFNNEDELALNKAVNNFLNKQFEEHKFHASINKNIIDNFFITTSKNIAGIDDDFDTTINNSKKLINTFIQSLINKYNKKENEE